MQSAFRVTHQAGVESPAEGGDGLSRLGLTHTRGWPCVQPVVLTHKPRRGGARRETQQRASRARESGVPPRGWPRLLSHGAALLMHKDRYAVHRTAAGRPSHQGQHGRCNRARLVWAPRQPLFHRELPHPAGHPPRWRRPLALSPAFNQSRNYPACHCSPQTPRTTHRNSAAADAF